MEACSNEIKERAMRLKRTASFSGSETANSGDRAINSPRTMRRKIIDAPTEKNYENVNGNSAELCLVEDEQNCRQKNINGISCDTSSPALGEEENLTLGSLHTSILVQVICNVSHDDLQSLSTVSQKFEEAVNVARQIHFDYKTPVRIKAPKRTANSFFLKAPKKSASFKMSRLSAQDIKELQDSTRRARMMIDDL
ncbi:hypothetical protein SUGI_0719230 [Cryptomeria japonica]|uniref:uncharacterized protein LOC131047321 n=1 Tax=Cryptomeria japonica TaxID=3369 RepID=UPI002414833D|nr:uncharacterized protein LOC131047321 [Cryptomeria japonica]GLJ35821.1 hypothetical protein SUGI_0719230 [Cryptomeria japonica]